MISAMWDDANMDCNGRAQGVVVLFVQEGR